MYLCKWFKSKQGFALRKLTILHQTGIEVLIKKSGIYLKKSHNGIPKKYTNQLL